MISFDTGFPLLVVPHCSSALLFPLGHLTCFHPAQLKAQLLKYRKLRKKPWKQFRSNLSAIKFLLVIESFKASPLSGYIYIAHLYYVLVQIGLWFEENPLSAPLNHIQFTWGRGLRMHELNLFWMYLNQMCLICWWRRFSPRAHSSGSSKYASPKRYARWVLTTNCFTLQTDLLRRHPSTCQYGHSWRVLSLFPGLEVILLPEPCHF